MTIDYYHLRESSLAIISKLNIRQRKNSKGCMARKLSSLDRWGEPSCEACYEPGATIPDSSACICCASKESISSGENEGGIGNESVIPKRSRRACVCGPGAVAVAWEFWEF